MSNNSAEPSFLVRAVALAEEIYKPEGVLLWLSARNKMLDNERPIDLIERGDGDRVCRLLDALCDGVFL